MLGIGDEIQDTLPKQEVYEGPQLGVCWSCVREEKSLKMELKAFLLSEE